MSSFDNIESTIRSQGLRITPQKKEVINYLYNNNLHPTIEDIYNHVSGIHHNVSKKTIYSIVESLEKANVVKVVEISDGVIRVDPNLSNHDHFVCTSCNKIFDCEKTDQNLAIVNKINHQSGDLLVEETEVLYRGTCYLCASNKSNK